MTAPGDFTSGDVLTAADMNGLPAGCVGYDLVTANVSLSTTPVTSHSVTYTRDGSRLYVAVFCALLEGNSVAGGEYRFDVKQAGVRRFAGRYDTTGTNQQVAQTVHVILAPTASGSETVTVDGSMSTGTGYFVAAQTNRSSLLIYDMGPA